MEECQGRQRWQLVRACYMKRADCFGGCFLRVTGEWDAGVG